jgi:hypothetical protein
MTAEDKSFTIYRTSDIYFASYLCALDLVLESTEIEDGGSAKNRKVMFLFKVPTKDLQRLKASFFGGSGTVKAQKFVQHLRSLKSMCFV